MTRDGAVDCCADVCAVEGAELTACADAVAGVEESNAPETAGVDVVAALGED